MSGHPLPSVDGTPGAGLHENGAASCSGRHRSADVSRTTRDREPPRIPPHPREPPPLTAARSPWRTRYVCLSAPSRPPTVKIVELPGFAEEKVDGDPPEFPLNPDLPRSFRNLVHFPFHPHHLLPLNQVTRRSSWLIRASRLIGGTGVPPILPQARSSREIWESGTDPAPLAPPATTAPGRPACLPSLGRNGTIRPGASLQYSTGRPSGRLHSWYGPL